MRSIGVVSTSRADYTAYRPVLKAFQADPEIDLKLYVSGMHLSPEFGSTVRFIEKDGFEITERVEILAFLRFSGRDREVDGNWANRF